MMMMITMRRNGVVSAWTTTTKTIRAVVSLSTTTRRAAPGAVVFHPRLLSSSASFPSSVHHLTPPTLFRSPFSTSALYLTHPKKNEGYAFLSSSRLGFSSTAAARTTTRLFSTTTTSTLEGDKEDSLFANDATTFSSIGIQSPILLERLTKLGLERPTKVQAGTFAKLARSDDNVASAEEEEEDGTGFDATNQNKKKSMPRNVIIGSETGSGKTLAYLLPLLDDILQQKQEQQDGQRNTLSYDYARAVILVPNKELVQQVLRMAMPLCGGPQSVIWSAGTTVDSSSGESSCPEHQLVRLAVLPGGLAEPLDFKPFRDTVALGGGTEPSVDLIVSTPAALGPLALSPKHIDMFADIETLVVDEADMLLDGGYIRPLENVLMGFKRADRLDPSMGVPRTQHVFCAATLPDMGLKSVDAYLLRKFPYAERVQMSGMHNARHYGLKQATQWIGPVETKKERMDQFVEMLETPVEEGGLLGEKVMVFLNSVEDVEGAQFALDKAGISSVPYHAKIKLDERSKVLDRFRRYDSASSKDDDSVSVLVCTDLASRGLDVPGVNAVVQLQFSGNVVSHLHRMGRCGRAGQRTGRGIVFYNEAEAELVQVVQEAEDQQERMILEGDVDDQLGDDDGGAESGKVQKAFSRKRGFTKKRKKLKREEIP